MNQQENNYYEMSESEKRKVARVNEQVKPLKFKRFFANSLMVVAGLGELLEIAHPEIINQMLMKTDFYQHFIAREARPLLQVAPMIVFAVIAIKSWLDARKITKHIDWLQNS